jgi:hypothetical protein
MLSKPLEAFFGILAGKVLVEVMREYGKDNNHAIVVLPY